MNDEEEREIENELQEGNEQEKQETQKVGELQGKEQPEEMRQKYT